MLTVAAIKLNLIPYKTYDAKLPRPSMAGHFNARDRIVARSFQILDTVYVNELIDFFQLYGVQVLHQLLETHCTPALMMLRNL